MPTIGILPIEYMGIEEILGITYREKNAYTANISTVKSAAIRCAQVSTAVPSLFQHQTNAGSQ